MESRTIRELGGEIWAESQILLRDDDDVDFLNEMIDIAMGVLARHTGKVIQNDSDLPVEPLPKAHSQ